MTMELHVTARQLARAFERWERDHRARRGFFARLAARFTRQEDPARIERSLVRIVPRADWGRFPHLLIWHGRRICGARRPLCEACVLAELCPAARVF